MTREGLKTRRFGGSGVFGNRKMVPYKAFAAGLLTALLVAAASGQDRATGAIKGKLRMESGTVVAGAAVIAQQGEREVARTETNRKGEFVLAGLTPGFYKLTFRKPGLSVGSISNIEVRAGRVRTLRDRLILPVDEGTLAFVRGSVFDPAGHSMPGVRVELALLEADGATKRLDSHITDESGSFSFRLKPIARRYRVTAKADGMKAAAKDVAVDSAEVYRIALSLAPDTK